MNKDKRNAYQREWYKNNPRKQNKEYTEKYYQENKERLKKIREKYVRNNPEKRLLTSLKNRAKKSGLDCNVTIEDIVIPEFCPILGIKITIGGDRETSPSVDRIDSTKGYVKGNVAVVSFKANRLKADGTMEQHLAIAEWMKRQEAIQMKN